MFIGEYTYSIDEKKRLAIPAKFRQLLGKKAVITRGLDQCLFLYPAKEWGNLTGPEDCADSEPRSTGLDFLLGVHRQSMG